MNESITVGAKVRVNSRSGGEYIGEVVAISGDMVSVAFPGWDEARDARELWYDKGTASWRPNV